MSIVYDFAFLFPVYHEYQRQLWDPDVFSKSNQLLSEYYSIFLGNLGIIMIDQRTTGGIYKSRREKGDDSLYGMDQINQFQADLDKFSDVKMLVICSTLPLFFIQKKMSELIMTHSDISDDLESFINVHHQDELTLFLDKILKWKQKTSPTSPVKDVLIFAGDVHLGGFTDIYKQQVRLKEIMCN